VGEWANPRASLAAAHGGVSLRGGDGQLANHASASSGCAVGRAPRAGRRAGRRAPAARGLLRCLVGLRQPRRAHSARAGAAWRHEPPQPRVRARRGPRAPSAQRGRAWRRGGSARVHERGGVPARHRARGQHGARGRHCARGALCSDPRGRNHRRRRHHREPLRDRVRSLARAPLCDCSVLTLWLRYSTCSHPAPSTQHMHVYMRYPEHIVLHTHTHTHTNTHTHTQRNTTRTTHTTPHARTQARHRRGAAVSCRQPHHRESRHAGGRRSPLARRAHWPGWLWVPPGRAAAERWSGRVPYALACTHNLCAPGLRAPWCTCTRYAAASHSLVSLLSRFSVYALPDRHLARTPCRRLPSCPTPTGPTPRT